MRKSPSIIGGAVRRHGRGQRTDRRSPRPGPDTRRHSCLQWDAIVDFCAYDPADIETLVEVAGDAGLDPATIVALLAGGQGRAEVLAEEPKLRRAGVAGVPAFLIGNLVVIAGAAPVEALAEAFVSATRMAM